MTFYAKYQIVRHIRMAITGLLVATFGVSSLIVPVAQAYTALPNPGFGTFLAVSSDSISAIENRPVTLKTVIMDSTAYTSRVAECDADPFVTADGSDVRDGILATNMLPFGTKVRLPTVFGDRIFEVHDRMNTRYTYRVDVWMADLSATKKYGVKRKIPIEVVEWGTNKTQWAARSEKIKAERLAAKLVKEIALAK